ncbi:MAG: hypothetical protein JSS75_01370 [Bacteroidetes bacterium]|nr:hypothetical protein [Bacteroidota bacterium]
MSRICLFVIVAVVCVCAGSVFAQERTTGTRTEVDSTTGVKTVRSYVEEKKVEDVTPRHDMLVVNPLKFFVFYNLSYYHAFSERIAGGIGLQTPTLSGISGFGANAELRFYPSKHALRGFYIAPNVSFNSLSSTDTYANNSVSATTFSVGVLLGWQWFPGDDFAIGLGIGYDRYFLNGSTSGVMFGSYNGGVPALRFDIGYAW